MYIQEEISTCDTMFNPYESVPNSNNTATPGNYAVVSGEVIKTPEFSHELYGEIFLETVVKVKRLSDSYDYIPVTFSERLANLIDVNKGAFLSFSGQFRSYNRQEGIKTKLCLTLFARSIEEVDEKTNPNFITLTGFVCRPTVYRTTPLGREIGDVLLAVNRAFSKSDYIPCIAWGRTAKFVSTLAVGAKIKVCGRIQSREYTKQIGDRTEVRTAYEISITTAESVNE
ncbi:MAG: single-stranded DNA-binding protein [Christensenellaceae bacterium]|jgi:single-stranded DNA-binding protein|nr:single-stranded DNA-binding protein [Christensenellaceae bacterium]